MPGKSLQVPGVKGGEDTLGIKYGSTDEMWAAELGRADPTSDEGWYGEFFLSAAMAVLTLHAKPWVILRWICMSHKLTPVGCTPMPTGKGVKYWDGVDATVDGVLGGYGKVIEFDAYAASCVVLSVHSNHADPKCCSFTCQQGSSPRRRHQKSLPQAFQLK
jgi:hypothetical protein